MNCDAAESNWPRGFETFLLLSLAFLLCDVTVWLMNAHQSHKIKRVRVVENSEIVYCDYCSLFVSHPEIEQPCKGKPDLLAKIKRMESLNGREQSQG